MTNLTTLPEQNQPEVSVEALQAGDMHEFSRLVDAYSRPVYWTAMKMLNNAQDAEDVLQDTFLKAYQHLKDFEGRASLSTWLHRIAINEALMRLRKRNPAQVSLDEPLETEEGELQPLEIVDWHALPENELLSEESRRYLDEAVSQLSPLLRAVFVLRDIEGLSVRQTAEALDLTETAVKTRLLRARLRLRELLTVYFSERMVENK